MDSGVKTVRCFCQMGRHFLTGTRRTNVTPAPVPEEELMRIFPSRAKAAGLACAALAAAGAVVAVAPPAQAACADVSIISARGTGEPQEGSWLLQPMGERIRTGLTGLNTTYTELQYPARLTFDTSATEGVTNLVRLLNTSAQECPDQRYVLLGYSQGGGVVGDALLPNGQRIWGKNAPQVSSAASSRIAAIVMFGEMRFTASDPFNVGDFDPNKESIRPRPRGALNAYADRIRNYCVADDFVCQDPGSTLAHLRYFVNGMPRDGADFAVSKVRAALGR